MPVIRVLLADDHPIVRDGPRLVLETADDLEVVGEASDGVEALALVGSDRPDVVLMDLRMPGMDGIEATRRVREEFPEVEIVVLTTYGDDDLLLRALRAGARGYLMKDTARAVLLDTIRAAALGRSLLSGDVLARVLGASSEVAGAPVTVPPAAILTPREHEVLALAAQGLRTRDIGRRLGLSERTVKSHLASTYLKLDAPSRAAAVARAARLGLLD